MARHTFEFGFPAVEVGPRPLPILDHSYKIIQASPPRTGSTVLYNLLYGFICPAKPSSETNNEIKQIVITHNTDLNYWEERLSGVRYQELKGVKWYFVCSERQSLKPPRIIDPKYYHKKNLLRIQFEELNETPEYPLEQIVENLYAKLKNLLPSDVKLDKESAINRINKMNLRYEEIKDKGFDYVDEFYGLHGSHRNRND
tara:strand:- start:2355 stop:2954 length:600 start_codon:yes stop_codon:yes gene_type:complete